MTDRPPPVLDNARVLQFAILPQSIPFAGRSLVFVDGKELGRVPRLAICEDQPPAKVLLFYCDDQWRVLAAAGYDSIDLAKARAERTYPGSSALWKESGVSEKEAEDFRNNLFGDDRCSFCGKRPDQIEQLISKDDVRICNYCIDEFYDSIHEKS